MKGVKTMPTTIKPAFKNRSLPVDVRDYIDTLEIRLESLGDQLKQVRKGSRKKKTRKVRTTWATEKFLELVPVVFGGLEGKELDCLRITAKRNQLTRKQRRNLIARAVETYEILVGFDPAENSEDNEVERTKDKVYRLADHPLALKHFLETLHYVKQMVIVAYAAEDIATNDLNDWINASLKIEAKTVNWFQQDHLGPAPRRPIGTYYNSPDLEETFHIVFSEIRLRLVELTIEVFSCKPGKKSNGRRIIGVCPYCEKIFKKERESQIFCGSKAAPSNCKVYHFRMFHPAKEKRGVNSPEPTKSDDE